MHDQILWSSKSQMSQCEKREKIIGGITAVGQGITLWSKTYS